MLILLFLICFSTLLNCCTNKKITTQIPLQKSQDISRRDIVLKQDCQSGSNSSKEKSQEIKRLTREFKSKREDFKHTSTQKNTYGKGILTKKHASSVVIGKQTGNEKKNNPNKSSNRNKNHSCNIQKSQKKITKKNKESCTNDICIKNPESITECENTDKNTKKKKLHEKEDTSISYTQAKQKLDKLSDKELKEEMKRHILEAEESHLRANKELKLFARLNYFSTIGILIGITGIIIGLTAPVSAAVAAAISLSGISMYLINNTITNYINYKKLSKLNNDKIKKNKFLTFLKTPFNK